MWILKILVVQSGTKLHKLLDGAEGTGLDAVDCAPFRLDALCVIALFVFFLSSSTRPKFKMGYEQVGVKFIRFTLCTALFSCFLFVFKRWKKRFCCQEVNVGFGFREWNHCRWRLLKISGGLWTMFRERRKVKVCQRFP